MQQLHKTYFNRVQFMLRIKEIEIFIDWYFRQFSPDISDVLGYLPYTSHIGVSTEDLSWAWTSQSVDESLSVKEVVD